MKLTEEQLKSVGAWFAGGATLDEIQKRLVAEYGVHLTYFDLRMIVADLPQPEEGAQEEAPPPEETPDDAGEQELAPPGEDEARDKHDSSDVTVTCDAIMIPGTLASGDVAFSDGVKGKWYLDQTGRLGLGGDLPQGYRPSPADAALFQARLMEALRAKGLY